MAKHALFWDYQYQSVAPDSPGMKASHNLAVTHILAVSLKTRSFATGTPTEASLRETTRPTVTSSHTLSGCRSLQTHGQGLDTHRTLILRRLTLCEHIPPCVCSLIDTVLTLNRTPIFPIFASAKGWEASKLLLHGEQYRYTSLYKQQI
jgi:hypothetical protein